MHVSHACYIPIRHMCARVHVPCQPHPSTHSTYVKGQAPSSGWSQPASERPPAFFQPSLGSGVTLAARWCPRPEPTAAVGSGAGGAGRLRGDSWTDEGPLPTAQRKGGPFGKGRTRELEHRGLSSSDLSCRSQWPLLVTPAKTWVEGVGSTWPVGRGHHRLEGPEWHPLSHRGQRLSHRQWKST